jgi:FHS family L-fucose permease-like MFS transporter
VSTPSTNAIGSRRALITPGYVFATILIVGLFFMWGIANSLNDVLIPQFRKAFQLDDFASSLVQSAFYFGYFCFAIPASLFMRRFGYRAAVLLGLALYGAGALLFLPAANASHYYAFLGALYVIASGLAFLETSANPLIAVMGPAGSADQRLNFAQTFNPVGTMMGSYIGGLLIFSDVHHTPEEIAVMTPAALDAFRSAELAAVKLPYMLIAAMVVGWAVLVACVKFPPVDEPREAGAGADGGFRGLLAFPHYWLGVLAQFAYVGAQVGVWSFLIRYTQVNFPGTLEKDALHWLPISFAIFFAGRLIGTLLMSRVNAEKLLALFAAINVVLCLVAVATGGTTGLYALIASSFFMSIMFPTIFTISLRGLGPYTKSGSSFLVMAIIGGAVFTAIMGWMSRESSINIAYIVPAACFAVVFAFAWASRRTAATPA